MTTLNAQQRLQALQGMFANPTQAQKLLAEIDVPQAVKTFVGKLQVLESVPSNYLVPLADMLPKESLRFFYLDQNWIECLIDGAFSVGRVSELDHSQDAAYLDALLQAAWEWVQESRPEAAGVSSSDPITGFVLRSRVVKHYASMQVHAYSGGTPMAPSGKVPLIRLDHLAEDVLLGLFSGQFKYLALSKPPEMLHFGFEVEPTGTVRNQYSNPTLYVYLRKPSDPSVGTETGDCVGWGTDDNRRVRVSQLAGALKTALAAHTFTSSEFALEMIHGADTVVFINDTFRS
jgi:hypothetical protein